jgi:hypothetical protein
VALASPGPLVPSHAKFRTAVDQMFGTHIIKSDSKLTTWAITKQKFLEINFLENSKKDFSQAHMGMISSLHSAHMGGRIIDDP